MRYPLYCDTCHVEIQGDWDCDPYAVMIRCQPCYIVHHNLMPE